MLEKIGNFFCCNAYFSAYYIVIKLLNCLKSHFLFTFYIGDEDMINFVLCDDNTQLLYKLKDMLESIFINNNLDARIAFVTNNCDKLIDFINSNIIDVLFLDIDLNSKYNGIELAKIFRKTNNSMYLIFLTGHFEYILSAYECKTFDFIQKPFSQSQLEHTIRRIFDDLYDNSLKFIKVSKNKSKLLNQNLINYIQKDGMKTIYNIDSGTVEAYGSFINITETLPHNFIRCHKSYIVNINKINQINFKDNIIFFKKSKCFIGPKYKNNFMEVLNNYGNF